MNELPIIEISAWDFYKIPKENLHGIYMLPGSTKYIVNGKRHRLDGPAIEARDGSYKYYYINGKEYCNDENYWNAVYLFKNNIEDYG